MSQKFRTLLVAMLCIMFFTISNTANAANVEVTKDFFKSFMNGSVNMWNFVDPTTKHITYEDNNVSIMIVPAIESNNFWSIGGVREKINKMSDGLIMCIDQAPLGGQAYYLDIQGAIVTIKNKTNNVIVWDLNKSSVSIGSYTGRPVTDGIKYADMGSAVIPPVIIPPQTQMQKEIMRADYTFYPDGENSRWNHPAGVFTDTNVFGNGYFVLDLSQNNVDNYVTIQACVIFPSNAFDNYLKKKKK